MTSSCPSAKLAIMIAQKDRPVTVSITGIDGAGKSTAEVMTTQILIKEHSILKPSRPVYTIIDGKKQIHYANATRAIDNLHHYADRWHSRTLVSVVNAFSLILSSRVFEPTLIDKYHPEVVMHGRDYYIDPAVYSIFYSPQLGSRPMEERVDRLQQMFRAPFRDMVFFLDLSPEEAVTRITARLARERANPQATEREKWQHMHENVSVLTLLRAEYYSALSFLEDKSPQTTVFRIDMMDKRREEVAECVAAQINLRLRKK